MTPKIILAFILLLFAFSCKKDANGGSIIGKWRTTEFYFASNGPLQYTAQTPAGPLYIQFNWPGTVQSTYFTKCTGYSIKGNNLTLINTGAANITCVYTIKSDTLTLSPDNCPSGNCNTIFVKE